MAKKQQAMLNILTCSDWSPVSVCGDSLCILDAQNAFADLHENQQFFFWHALQPSTALPSDFSNVIPAREKQGSEIQRVECSALPLQQHTRPDLKRPHALQAKCQESLPERSLNCVFMAYCHLIIKLRMFLLYLKLFFLFCCQISPTLLYYNIVCHYADFRIWFFFYCVPNNHLTLLLVKHNMVFIFVKKTKQKKNVVLICFVHFCFWILQKVNGTSESQLIKNKISPAFVQTTANWVTSYWYSIKCHKYSLTAYRPTIGSLWKSNQSRFCINNKVILLYFKNYYYKSTTL